MIVRIVSWRFYVWFMNFIKNISNFVIPLKKQRYIFGNDQYILTIPFIIKLFPLYIKKIYRFFIPHPFITFYRQYVLRRPRRTIFAFDDDYNWPLRDYLHGLCRKLKTKWMNKKISFANKVYFSNFSNTDDKRYKELFLSLSLRVKDCKHFNFILYPPRFTKKLKEAMYSVYHGKCAYCGVKFNFRFMGIDHVIPQQHGGPHNLLNYVLACCFHNSLKRDLILHPSILKKMLTIAEKKANKILHRLATG